MIAHTSFFLLFSSALSSGSFGVAGAAAAFLVLGLAFSFFSLAADFGVSAAAFPF
jgi:hypothetical protein